MGKGIEAARSSAPAHAALLDDMKDQLIIVLMKRLVDDNGKLQIPCDEIDDTGSDTLSFRVDEDRVFHFQMGKKS